MADITIVSKRLHALHSSKTIISENGPSASVLKEFRDIKDLRDVLESFCETGAYNQAVYDLKSKTGSLPKSDIIAGAHYIADNIVPKIAKLSEFRVFCNEILLDENYNPQRVDLASFYSNDLYKDALKTVSESSENTNPYYYAYEIITEAITENRAADRVINNHEMLSKRYNFDKIVQENMNHLSSDQSSLVWKICDLVATFNNFTYYGQYTACLENTLYLFNKTGMLYSRENIMESATDYFLLIHERQNMDLYNMKNVIRNNTFFKDTEFAKNYLSIDNDIREYMSTIQRKYNLPDEYMNDLEIVKSFMEKDMQETFVEGCRHFVAYAHSNSPFITNKLNSYSLAESVIKKNTLRNNLSDKTLSNKTIDDLINEFKIKDKKDVGTFKNLINKIYAKSPTDAINHTPSILNLIRMTITYSTIVLLPIIGTVISIIDAAISSNINREQTEKMIKFFNEEKEKVKDEIRHTNDPEKKGRLNKYFKEINNAISSLIQYREEMTVHYEPDNDNRDLDDMIQVPVLFEVMNTISRFNPNDTIQCLRENYRILPLEFIDSITELSLLVSAVIDRDQVYKVLKESYEEISKNPIKDYMTNLNISNCLYENMTKIEICKYDYEDFYVPVVELAEVLKLLDTHLKNKDYLLEEASVQNAFKLAAVNIKIKVTSLSGIQRDEVTKMNTFVTTVKNEIEDYANKGTRKDALQTSVLPKFVIMINLILDSKQATAIKVSIASAAVSWLGTLACRPNATDDERRMIFNEIITQIEAVNKKILTNEKNDDFDNYKELRDLKRNLEREAQHIKNKAKLIGRPL